MDCDCGRKKHTALSCGPELPGRRGRPPKRRNTERTISLAGLLESERKLGAEVELASGKYYVAEIRGETAVLQSLESPAGDGAQQGEPCGGSSR